MLDAILQDLRYALRTLRSSPGFSAVAILSLALGIGANTAIFSLINAVMLKSLPVSHPEELLQVWADENHDSSFTNPMWEALRDRQDVFSGISAFAGTRFNLAVGGEARMAWGYFTGGQFFETLGVLPWIGRTYTAADDKRGCPATAVLSYSFWQKEYGGNPGVVGGTILLDTHPFQIVGVAQPGFVGVNVGISFDIFAPLCAEPIVRGENSALDRRSSWWMRVLARPKPGITVAQASARLRTLSSGVFESVVPPDYNPEDKRKFLNSKLSARPAPNGLSNIRTEYRQALLILMAVVVAVLLIACANVANLLLARGAVRQREIAIRMALGSGRGRLIRQLLTESLLLSLLGAAMGVVFARWGGRLLVGFLGSTRIPVFLDLSIDGRVLAFTAGVAVFTGLLFGLAPAWRGTRVQPQTAMKANARGVIEGAKFGLGKALVTFQVALSLLLVVGAGLMLTTFFKLSTVHTGFDQRHVLLVQVDLRNAHYPLERRLPAFAQIVDRLQSIPGVTSASASDGTPINGSVWSGDVFAEANSMKHHVYFNQVSARYFESMSTPLLAGRDFDARDTLEAPKVAIINRTMAVKLFGTGNPLGKTFTAPTSGVKTRLIVGVVGDAKYASLRDVPPPTAFIALSQEEKPGQYCNFEVRAAGPPSALIPAARSAIAEVNRDVVLQFTTLSTQLDESLKRDRLLATLSGFFGVLALLLATIGLYGVMSYNVARRRNEIGIRMALGAEGSRVMRMILGEVAILIATGLIVGLGAALATTHLLASFLYEIKPNDPLTLLLAAAVLALVGAFAGFVPARRASLLDPMAALREE
jgi:putative ABC transport system permease protein